MEHARGFVSCEDEKQVTFVMRQYFQGPFSFAIHLVSFFFWEIQTPHRVLPLPLMLLHDLCPDMIWHFQRFFHQRFSKVLICLNHYAGADDLLGNYYLVFAAYHPGNGETPLHGC
jgi:hypothetical protein